MPPRSSSGLGVRVDLFLGDFVCHAAAEARGMSGFVP